MAQVTVDTDAPDAQAIAATFRAYATGINTGDYDKAYGMLGPGFAPRSAVVSGPPGRSRPTCSTSTSPV
jgi:hypothetical protein